jgi:hypothetical protein
MMAEQVVMGAAITCSFGTGPAALVVTPTPMVNVSKVPAATIMDFAPMTNIPTFIMCTTPSNPTVASATAAAFGVLTPMPCVPVTTPWKPGVPTVTLGKMAALDNASTCNCCWGGIITVTSPGQAQTTVG